MTHESLRDSVVECFWYDDPSRPMPNPPLNGDTAADLLIVGGGFTGLWAALSAKEADPSRDVVLIEADQAGSGASGRNGGFIAASLTHSIANGLSHWPNEFVALEKAGDQNFEEMVSIISGLDLDARYTASGELNVATEEYQVDELRRAEPLMRSYGYDVEFLEKEAVRASVASPTYLGGLLQRDRVGLVDPARLVWGLLAAAEAAGVRVFEQTPLVDMHDEGGAVRVTTPAAKISAKQVLLATNGYRAPRIRRFNSAVVPVWDYVLATEPLSDSQLSDIGWADRQGIGDSANHFHYYRMTHDNRIIWGGLDAVYKFGSKTDRALSDRPETHERLARNFFATFPQLEGLRFTHRWGGVIGTTSRFTVAFGSAFSGKVVWAAGYTGLGVGASRFGARVGLALLDDPADELLRLPIVTRRPFPFPPEPLRYAAIQMTDRALRRADSNEGRRGPWLRILDKFGIGFNS